MSFLEPLTCDLGAVIPASIAAQGCGYAACTRAQTFHFACRENHLDRLFEFMKKLFLMFFFTGAVAVFGQDASHDSTLTLGVGVLPYSSSDYYPQLQKGGPAFTANYEYRFLKYLAAEIGTDVLLPSGKALVQSYSILPGTNQVTYVPCPTCGVLVSGTSRVSLLSYGFKGILPLASGRVELFAGVGGAYGWNSRFSGSLNSAFGQASIGGRVALDSDHRFWLGATFRGYDSFGSRRQIWAPLTFELGIRFKH
jgi:hypothetical protein